MSCHAITWGRDGLETALRDMVDNGFHGIETFAYVVDDFEGNERAFQDLLAGKDMRLVSLYGGGQMCDPAQREKIIATNLRYARFLRAQGAVPLTLGPGRRSPTGPNDDDLRELATTMNEIGKQASEFGVLACCHPHWGTTVQNRDEITKVFDLVDPRYVFMTADPAHMAKAGYDPVEVFSTYRSIIKYVHLKDYKPQGVGAEARVEGSGGTAILPDFVEFGYGVIDLPALVKVLRDANYDGWLTIELDRSTRGARASLEINKRYIEDVLHLSVDTANPF
jgi:inosose dehydratase